MKRISVIWISIILASSSTFLLIDVNEDTEGKVVAYNGVEYVPHAPIRINSNADFDETHGVINWASGDGSQGNPWIIEGWDINGTGVGFCLYIGNTTDNFEVRNCSLHHANGVWAYPYFVWSGINLYKVSNSTLNNNTFFSNNYGLRLFGSNNNTFSYNHMFQNVGGIFIHWTESIGSKYNTVIYNNLSNNLGGITMWEYSTHNTIHDNSICGNEFGIWLYEGGYNIIRDNDISNNTDLNPPSDSWKGYGMYLFQSPQNIVSNNTLINNWGSGIFMGYSENNSFTNNTMVNGGFRLQGWPGYDFNTHSIDESNIINGKPVFYLKNQTGGSVPSYAGQILLVNCTNMTIENFTFQNLYTGIFLGDSENISIFNITSINNVEGINTLFSNNNTIRYCNLSSNDMHGLWIRRSNENVIDTNIISYNNRGFRINACYNNTIRNNNVSFNTEHAINLTGTLHYNNSIYQNNFINNGNQGYQCSDRGTDFWNVSYPGGGNYWSDYDGVDLMSGPGQDQPDSDGFGDTNYSIDWGTNADHYPLMKPIEFKFTNHNLSLTEGWNLISLPLIQGDESLDKVLESINGKWDYIQAYDSINDIWLSNGTTRPDNLNELNTLNHKMGFWINITESNVNLTVMGHVPISTTIPLYAGWNLVSYPTLTKETVANSLWGTGSDKVEVFDPAEPYRIKEVGPAYVMKPGEGYWIHVVADSVWVVDY